jgi:hypothetical protein
MSERCKHVEKNGFNCGSYAFNLYKDGIDQGNLCDVHYWQAKALAQPELCKYGQEPKSCTSSPMDCQCAIDAALAQQEQDHIPDARKMVTEQEPVAHCEAGPEYCPVCNTELNQEPAIYPEEAYEMGLEEIAFYTAPPRRTWVGLTDDEIIDVLHPLVMADMSDEATDYEIARAIEAKLKEKNT